MTAALKIPDETSPDYTAYRLHWKMWHLDPAAPTPEEAWDALDEREKEFLRILAKWFLNDMNSLRITPQMVEEGERVLDSYLVPMTGVHTPHGFVRRMYEAMWKARG